MYGAEVLTEEGKERIREEGWVVVKGWKEQMRPIESPSSSAPSSEAKKKLLRKAKPAAVPSHAQYASRLAPSSSPMGTSTTSLASIKASMWSVSSEGLLDAVDARADHEWVDLTNTTSNGSNDSSTKAAPLEKKRKVVKVHSGPRLRDIYAAWLKHLTAWCASPCSLLYRLADLKGLAALAPGSANARLTAKRPFSASGRPASSSSRSRQTGPLPKPT